MKYKYPLQTDSFNIWDRLKVCFFLLNRKNKLTIGPKVEEFEAKWAQYAKTDAIATSSGSTANILLVETFLQTYAYNPEDVTVFIPSTTWASSVSCWSMRGCKIVFVDINLYDFSFDYEKLNKTVARSKSKIKVIWPTALIGNIPDVNRLNQIAGKHGAYLFADLCETTIGFYKGENILSCFDMSTTSFFWAHEINMIEGGMLFTKFGTNRDIDKINNAEMIRSHGLSRVLHNQKLKKKLEEENSHINPEFLFINEGTNFRPTDLNAVFGLIDFKKLGKYTKHRTKIWKCFLDNLNKTRFMSLNPNIVPFSLPIILNKMDNSNFEESSMLGKIKNKLKELGFESRPIISFVANSPAYKKYAGNKTFPNSAFLDRMGIYVGISNKLKENDVLELCAELNNL